MRRVGRTAALVGSMVLTVLSLSPGIAWGQASSGASVGVIVDAVPTTTTLPVPVTAPSVTVPTSTTLPTTSTSTTLADVTATTLLTTEDSLAETLPQPQPVKASGFSAQVRSAANATKQLFKGIASGKPLADVAEAVLPKEVAAVVVPAVRTASTFVFPIGLAGAVIAFLVLQQRVDSSDPKLTAAPLAHDDDVVTFS